MQSWKIQSHHMVIYFSNSQSTYIKYINFFGILHFNIIYKTKNLVHCLKEFKLKVFSNVQMPECISKFVSYVLYFYWLALPLTYIMCLLKLIIISTCYLSAIRLSYTVSLWCNSKEAFNLALWNDLFFKKIIEIKKYP